MEVHHHPNVEKKNFKAYFLEFLMIFLAVTMGFFAESYRESITENEHVHQLSEQLLLDFKSDTTDIANNINKELSLINYADTLFTLLQQPVAKADLKKIQQLVYLSFSISFFRSSSGTIAAIKNELHLKQFSNTKITVYIGDYEKELSRLKAIEDIRVNMLQQYIAPFISQHFVPDNIKSLVRENKVSNNNMRNLQQEDFTQLSVDIEQLIDAAKTSLYTYTMIKAKAEAFIQFIQKEYHLEKE